MMQKYQPSKPKLFRRVALVHERILKLWGWARVHFTHVKRSGNAWADWLCRCALHAKWDVELSALVSWMPVYHEAVPVGLFHEVARSENITQDNLQAFGSHIAPALPLCIRCGERIQLYN